MSYQSLIKDARKDFVYLSEVANLANLNHYPNDEVESQVQSFFVDLEDKVFSTWNQAEVFIYRDKAFLVREFTTNGEDYFDEETKVLDEEVWLEVIELILAEVRKEALYKLLNYI
jgi:hypothetical protein